VAPPFVIAAPPVVELPPVPLPLAPAGVLPLLPPTLVVPPTFEPATLLDPEVANAPPVPTDSPDEQPPATGNVAARSATNAPTSERRESERRVCAIFMVSIGVEFAAEPRARKRGTSGASRTPAR
jgi:hypothetical protein